MSLYIRNTKAVDHTFDQKSLGSTSADKPVVLVVEDQNESRSEMLQVLEMNGYRVIETDNGQDAVKRGRYVYPDLLLVDLNLPLLYEMVAARRIVKNAELGMLPVVIITHDDEVDPAAIMEAGVRRNEYVTRLSDYDQLQHLLDYLLPVTPQAA
jgi:CheY-like chemotaxis protein